MSSSEIVPLLHQILSRLSSIEGKVGLSSPESGDKAVDSSADSPRSVKEFDSYASAFLDPFVAACEKLGGDCTSIGLVVKEAWAELRAIILMASKCKEPLQAVLPQILAPLSSKLKEAKALVKKK
jgi:adenylyl cyclase-associated protein